MFALEPLHTLVDLDVLVEVSFLCEAEAAVGIGAGVGSFVGVNSEMIEEVVPFSEMFPAVIMITLKNLNVPLGLGIFEGEDAELLGSRYMLFNLYRLQVEGLSCLYEDCDILRNVIEGITVFYI